MSADLQCRFYRDEDVPGIVDVLRLCFDDWAKRENPLDYWNWKYRSTPLGSLVALVKVDDVIAGTGHRLRYTIKVGDHVLRSQHGDDFATHPDFRGRGVFTKVLNLLEDERRKDGRGFIYTITTNPIVVKDNLKRGRFDFPQPLVHMILVNKAKSGTQAGIYLLGGLNRIAGKYSAPPIRHGDYVIDAVTGFDSSLDAFYERVKGSYDFIVERNREFLNWRYGDRRGGEFLIEQAKRGDDLLGYVVLEKRERDRISEGYVADLLAEDVDVAASLLKDGLKTLQDLGVGTFHYRAVKNHPYLGIMRRYGFVAAPRMIDMHVLCQFDEPEEAEPLLQAAPGRLYFNYGDYF